MAALALVGRPASLVEAASLGQAPDFTHIFFLGDLLTPGSNLFLLICLCAQTSHRVLETPNDAFKFDKDGPALSFSVLPLVFSFISETLLLISRYPFASFILFLWFFTVFPLDVPMLP